MTGARFRLTFAPHDLLFFPAGTPFNQDDEGMAEAASDFPPRPHVLAAAARNTVASLLGWAPEMGGWEQHPVKGGMLSDLIGDGSWLFGGLRFRSPRLWHEETPHVPMPLNCARHPDANGLIPEHASYSQGNRFRAFASDVVSDLGGGGFFALSHETNGKLHAAEAEWGVDGVYLQEDRLGDLATENTVQAELGGSRNLDSEVPAETRLGIELDRNEKAARTGKLYVAGFRRPSDKISLSLDMLVNDDWLAGQIDGACGKKLGCTLGARGRTAAVTIVRLDDPAGPRAPPVGRELRLILLSPALVDPELFREIASPTDRFLGIDGLHLRGAAMRRMTRFAGWDHGQKARGWLRLIESGAVFAVAATTEAARAALTDRLAASGLNHSGSDAGERHFDAGFGEVHVLEVRNA